MNDIRATTLLGALIISLGIAGCGIAMGVSLYWGKKAARSMTVKGIAEKDVTSDLAIWEIDYREVGADLVAVNQRLQHDQETVVAFLTQQGFKAEEISAAQIKVEDREANVYNTTSTDNKSDQRFVVTAGVRIRSEQVDKIRQATQAANMLLQQGVPLSFDVSVINPNPSFYYTKLDAIRPEMMTVATSSAKAVANQFAKDTGSTLDGIQRASQGVFQVMDRDTSTMNSDWNSNQFALGSVEKKVRLVTTIDYRLK